MAKNKKVPKKSKPKAKKVVKKKAKKEKIIGKIENYFDKVSVMALTVKNPIKVGDIIHVKGHTTDFYQEIGSMQIDRKDILKAKKGDDVGIKISQKVRDHDVVYLAPKGKKPELPPPPKFINF